MDPEPSPHCVAVVPAAGQGIRMDTAIKKQFMTLGGEPVLVHTMRALASCPEVHGIILVVPEEDVTFCEEKIVRDFKLDKVHLIVPGGEERQDSVYRGLQALSEAPDIVVVHDGVRPFLTPRMVREVVTLAREGLAAVVGVPVSDTIKAVDGTKTVIKTFEREQLWAVQTPQAFAYRQLLEAHREACQQVFCGTDDAALIERMGFPVRLIMGSHDNIKITSPADLVLGETILKMRLEHADRTGI